MLISSSDVLHARTVPSLGVKVDAVPGRLNQLKFISQRPGIFFGQCSEICGANHRFMPIVLEVISHVFYYCDKDEGVNLQVVLDHQKRNVLENLIDVVKHVNETKELEEVSISTDVTPGDQKLKQVTSIPDDLSNGDKFEETLNPQKLIKEESNYPKGTKSQNNDYLIFSSQFDSNGHCSVEALDVSESSFLLKNFFQLNNLFKNIFPIFPSYLPFQLQKISLLGFSHICLSLPGSEVSLINLGLTEEKGINNSNENKCNCEPKNEESIMHHFSNAFKNFKNFFLSLI